MLTRPWLESSPEQHAQVKRERGEGMTAKGGPTAAAESGKLDGSRVLMYIISMD